MLAVLGGLMSTETKSVDRLVRDVPGARVVRGGDVRVARVRIDSRRIEAHDLFVAAPGTQDDGLRHVDDAMSRGAAGVVAPAGTEPRGEGAWIVADDVRLAGALLAAEAWDRPSDRIDVCGFTGTNGKTTCTWLLRAIAQASGRRPAVLGTFGVRLPGETRPQSRTTPEAPDLQESLDAAHRAGCDLVAMEVSSHALDLRRVDGTAFAAAAFLNLSPEHLDWHGTLDAYGRSKMRLFSDLLAPGCAPNGPRAILNASDPWADRFRTAVTGALLFSTGGSGDAEVVARGVRFSPAGSSFELVTPEGTIAIDLPLPGRHNVENALAAASVALVLGMPLAGIAAGLATAPPPPGRFERVHAGTFDAFVDYAHTEDGVRMALEVARRIAAGRVIVVMGCGGDRDIAKRPAMGRLAAELADVAIFTTDNPRSEDPQDIVEAMLEGAGEASDRVEIVMDREEALARAVGIAAAGDLVLALGKGHETYQEVAGTKIPFPEREILSRHAARRDGGEA